MMLQHRPFRVFKSNFSSVSDRKRRGPLTRLLIERKSWRHSRRWITSVMLN